MLWVLWAWLVRCIAVEIIEVVPLVLCRVSQNPWYPFVHSDLAVCGLDMLLVPWPPPMLVKIARKGANLRPIPWPSFEFCKVWKLQHHTIWSLVSWYVKVFGVNAFGETSLTTQILLWSSLRLEVCKLMTWTREMMLISFSLLSRFLLQVIHIISSCLLWMKENSHQSLELPNIKLKSNNLITKQSN